MDEYTPTSEESPSRHVEDFNPWREGDGEKLTEEQREQYQRWFKRIASDYSAAKEKSRDFSETYKEAIDFLLGDPVNSVNYAISRYEYLVLRSYMRDPEVLVSMSADAEAVGIDWTDLGVAPEEGEDAAKGVMLLMKNLLQIFIRRARMQEVVTAAVRDSKACGLGIVHVSYVDDKGEEDSQTIGHIPTVEDVAQQAIQHDEAKDDLDPDAPERAMRREQEKALEAAKEGAGISSMSMDGVRLESIAPDMFFFDGGIDDFRYIGSSRFMGHVSPIPVSKVALDYGIPETTLRDIVTPDKEGRGGDRVGDVETEREMMVEVVEFADRERGLVWHFIDGMKYPLRFPQRPVLSGNFFYNYYFLPDVVLPKRRYPESTLDQLRAPQKMIDAKHSQLKEIVEQARAGVLLNGRQIGKKAADRTITQMSSAEGKGLPFWKVDTQNAKDIREVMTNFNNMQGVDTRIFSLDEDRRQMEQVTGDSDPEMQSRTKSATEVAELASSREERVGMKRDAMEGVLGRVCEHMLALAMAYMDRSDVDALGLKSTYFPGQQQEYSDTIAEKLLSIFRVSVQSGSTDKQDEKILQEKSVMLLDRIQPRLTELIGIIPQLITLMPDNPSAADELTKGTYELLEQVIRRVDPSIDPSKILPPKPSQIAMMAQQGQPASPAEGAPLDNGRPMG